jgi:hypothetical protein
MNSFNPTHKPRRIRPVFFQEHEELLLKGPRAVMLRLLVNVGAEGIQICRANRKAAVAALPWHSDKFRAKGLFDASPGHRPRNSADKLFASANGAVHRAGRTVVVGCLLSCVCVKLVHFLRSSSQGIFLASAQSTTNSFMASSRY